MNENFTWVHDINALINKTSKKLSIIHRLKYILSDNALYCLYITLIQPYLDYCNIAGLHITLTSLISFSSPTKAACVITY